MSDTASDGLQTTGTARPGSTPTPDPTPDQDVHQAMAAEATGEARTFEWNGRQWPLAEKISALVLMDLSVSGTKTASQIQRVQAIRDLIQVAVAESHRGEFLDLLRYGDPPLGPEDLEGLVSAIMEAYAGRPTTQS